jgi:hypothetical protein
MYNYSSAGGDTEAGFYFVSQLENRRERREEDGVEATKSAWQLLQDHPGAVLFSTARREY